MAQLVPVTNDDLMICSFIEKWMRQELQNPLSLPGWVVNQYELIPGQRPEHCCKLWSSSIYPVKRTAYRHCIKNYSKKAMLCDVTIAAYAHQSKSEPASSSPVMPFWLISVALLIPAISVFTSYYALQIIPVCGLLILMWGWNAPWSSHLHVICKFHDIWTASDINNSDIRNNGESAANVCCAPQQSLCQLRIKDMLNILCPTAVHQQMKLEISETIWTA